MKALLGRKIGMTQIFADTGEVIPVTVIEAAPGTVTQIKTVETDGYDAVQVGFEDQKLIYDLTWKKARDRRGLHIFLNCLPSRWP